MRVLDQRTDGEPTASPFEWERNGELSSWRRLRDVPAEVLKVTSGVECMELKQGGILVNVGPT